MWTRWMEKGVENLTSVVCEISVIPLIYLKTSTHGNWSYCSGNISAEPRFLQYIRKLRRNATEKTSSVVQRLLSSRAKIPISPKRNYSVSVRNSNGDKEFNILPPARAQGGFGWWLHELLMLLLDESLLSITF